jgi:hypothetical protein
MQNIDLFALIAIAEASMEDVGTPDHKAMLREIIRRQGKRPWPDLVKVAYPRVYAIVQRYECKPNCRPEKAAVA